MQPQCQALQSSPVAALLLPIQHFSPVTIVSLFDTYRRLGHALFSRHDHSLQATATRYRWPRLPMLQSANVDVAQRLLQSVDTWKYIALGA